jgi:hypothetical protein
MLKRRQTAMYYKDAIKLIVGALSGTVVGLVIGLVIGKILELPVLFSLSSVVGIGLWIIVAIAGALIGYDIASRFLHEHLWGDWTYDAPDSCTKTKVCKICNRQEKAEALHDWSEPKYERPNECDRVRICRRCDKKQDLGKEHIFGDWSATNIYPCDFTRSCSRCPMIERKEEHIFGEWSAPPPCDLTRSCSRCPEVESMVQHDFTKGTGEYYIIPSNPDDILVPIYECTRCGIRDSS